MSETENHAYKKFLASELGCNLKDCPATELAFYGGCEAGHAQGLECLVRVVVDTLGRRSKDMTIKACDAGWAFAVGLVSAGVTAAVFAVALVVALLLEFIVTGHICEIVGESEVTIGGRICGAASLLAFVVGFGVAVWHAGRGDKELSGWLDTRDAELFHRGEEPARPWKRG